MSQSIIAAGAALLLGAAVTVAQPPQRQGQPPRDSAGVEGGRGRRSPGGLRGPEGMLLRGITLTDAQRPRVEALRQAPRARARCARCSPPTSGGGSTRPRRPAAARRPGVTR